MQEYFNDLVDKLQPCLRGTEVFTAYFEGEDSEFCRFNQAKIRQLGSVRQKAMRLRLIDHGKQCSAHVVMTGQQAEDFERLSKVLSGLRSQLPELPEDPFLLFNQDIQSSASVRENTVAPSQDMISDIVQLATGTDLVGIFTNGGVFRGFANSLGQRNWYETHSYLFDFSLYAHSDKAAKSGLAGFEWDKHEFKRRLDVTKAHVDLLGQSAKSIDRGRYDVYLAPAAVAEVMGTLAWGGFGLKSQRTKQSPLLQLVDGVKALHHGVSWSEDTEGGISPNFDPAGFTKPSCTSLVAKGVHQGSLVSARTAKEYGVTPTGASDDESPESFAMDAGSLPESEALKQLDKGLYISNLWYLNYSDRTNGRMTGMTRFATFWVEDGQIVAPLNVMRFDDSIFNLFGSGLEALTQEREFMPSTMTYDQRAAASQYVPGALIRGMTFTL